MRSIGRILGAIFGYLAGGFLGALIGYFVGRLFDKGLAQNIPGAPGVAARIQETFFRTTFTIMGHVCKADGQVSSAEIKAAEQIMTQMALSVELRRQAIEYFNQGKQNGYNPDADIRNFREVCRWQPNLIRFFLEVQLQAAIADGVIDPSERDVLLRIAQQLGLSAQEYTRLESLLRGERHQHQTGRSRIDSLAAAYEILGVQEDTSDNEIKKAYRRLISQHHPDKLVAKGLPKEMMEMAKQKTQEILAAYETIKEARSLK